MQRYLVPTVRAAVRLQQHDPSAAVELLRETVQYDLSSTQSFSVLYPAYIRGLAYLESGDGQSAAGEFQKLVDNPGLCWTYITRPTGPASTRPGTETDGRQHISPQIIRRVSSIWKDADPDLPIYRQAKAEYAQLQKH